MIFGFPEEERALFKNNFLRTVTFQYTYDSVEIGMYKDIISTSFSDSFPRITEGKNVSYEIKAANGQTPIIKSSTESNGFILLSISGLTRINFSNTAVVVTILGNAYRRFEVVLPILEKTIGVLSQCGVTILNRVSVRKVNIITFTTQADSISGVISDLFAPGIVNAIESFPQPEALRQNMHSIVLNKDDYRLNLNYGAPEFDNLHKPLTGSIVIDIDLHKGGNTETSALITTTRDLNKEIYNVFSWVTSEKMKQEIMQYE